MKTSKSGDTEAGKLQSIGVDMIDPSPFQPRKHFDEDSLKRLGETIKDHGLIQPIVVRPNGERFELVAGERRWRGAKLVGVSDLLARVKDLNDRDARLMALWENLHRADLSTLEEAMGTLDWLDACLAEEAEYIAGGDTPAKRVRKLLGEMAADNSNGTKRVIYNLINRVESAFTHLRRPTTWESFYTNDLSMVEELAKDKDLHDMAMREKLNKGQARAMVKMKKKAPEVFQKVLETGKIDVGMGEKVALSEASERELNWATRDGGFEKVQDIQPRAHVKTGRSPELLVASADALPLPNACVDIIITSPPYNLGPKKGNKEKRTAGRSSGGRAWEGIGYETRLPEDQYQEWQIHVLTELYRVAKKGCSLFYNHKVRQVKGRAIHPLEWLLKLDCGWVLRQEIIWDRGSTHNHEGTYFWPHDERIYWLTKGKPALPNKPINQATIWTFHGPVANTWHPSPFSDELPKRCLDAVYRPGCTVLDPFGGSMTTCRVALEFGAKRVIGCDNSADTVSRAAKENNWKVPA